MVRLGGQKISSSSKFEPQMHHKLALDCLVSLQNRQTWSAFSISRAGHVSELMPLFGNVNIRVQNEVRFVKQLTVSNYGQFDNKTSGDSDC